MEGTRIYGLAALLLLGAPAVPARAGDVELPAILPLRERAALRDRWLAERLDTVVPPLMRREGVDTWILVGREYNEDPVLTTMLPASWMSARRTMILVFHDAGKERGGVSRHAVSRYDVGDFFQSVWDPEEEPDQWKRFGALMGELRPRKIAVNVSDDFALADGLTSSLHVKLLRSLPPHAQRAVTLNENLAIGWLETRIPAELEVYPTIVRIAHVILAEGLSGEVVVPGKTTTDELEWWFRERTIGLHLGTWFHPSVTVQRPGQGEEGSFASRETAETIRPGDLVHVDFGITYLGLNTDTQQHAYVLREGEEAPPPGLVAAFAVGNRLQDILTGAFEEGRSGNEILAAALAKAAEEEIDATIYTHPLGNHGHGAGPTIGLWDQQEGVPGNGDYPLRPSTVHSIELNAAVPLPEWEDELVRIMLEEDALFDGEEVRYLDGRQTELFLIRP